MAMFVMVKKPVPMAIVYRDLYLIVMIVIHVPKTRVIQSMAVSTSPLEKVRPAEVAGCVELHFANLVFVSPERD
jgi:hypothetical protein